MGMSETDYQHSLSSTFGAASTIPSWLHPSKNEDTYLMLDGASVYAVFDGRGSFKANIWAATLAVEACSQFFSQFAFTPRVYSDDQAKIVINQALRGIDEILINSKSDVYANAAVSWFYESQIANQKRLAVASVGDCRAYLLSKDVLSPLTFDDSLSSTLKLPSVDAALNRAWNLQRAVDMAESQSDLNDAELTEFNRRTMVSARLGDHNSAYPNLVNDDFQVGIFDVFDGDRLLLTTDSVQDNLTIREIKEALVQEMTYAAALCVADTAAKRSRSTHFRAKYDDITAVVVDYKQQQ